MITFYADIVPKPSPRPRVKIRWVQFGQLKAFSLNGCERIHIRCVYERGFEKGDGRLDYLCWKLGRTKPWVVRQAKDIGLTNSFRKISYELVEKIKEDRAGFWKGKKHPRGMLGKKHSQETIETISNHSREQIRQWKETGRMSEITMKGLKTKAARGNLIQPRKASWKQSWAEVGGKRFYARSSWEIKYAQVLQRQKDMGAIVDWEHEPVTFWFEQIKRGCRSYTPDFRVTHLNGDIEYHEVKGWMDDRSKTKIKRMAIYHKNVKLVVIDSKAYHKIISRGF